jgi:hypothetical protein
VVSIIAAIPAKTVPAIFFIIFFVLSFSFRILSLPFGSSFLIGMA